MQLSLALMCLPHTHTRTCHTHTYKHNRAAHICICHGANVAKYANKISISSCYLSGPQRRRQSATCCNYNRRRGHIHIRDCHRQLAGCLLHSSSSNRTMELPYQTGLRDCHAETEEAKAAAFSKMKIVWKMIEVALVIKLQLRSDIYILYIHILLINIYSYLL